MSVSINFHLQGEFKPDQLRVRHLEKSEVFTVTVNSGSDDVCIFFQTIDDVLVYADEIKRLATILKAPVVKTRAEWKGNLSDYLQIGDLVDEELVEHFINVLPPTWCSGKLIQIGEPYDDRQGAEVYMTLKRTVLSWAYAGMCHKGSDIHIEKDDL